MKVGFLGGTGVEARGLALRFARAEVEVILGSRSNERAARAAENCNSLLGTANIRATTNPEMLSLSDLVFLTVPWEQAVDAVDSLRHKMRAGHVLVDVTVPLRFVDGHPAGVDIPEGSNAERIARHAPDAVHVVGAFKTEPAHVLGEVGLPLDCDTFVCGDSSPAKERVIELARRLPGLRPLDAGPLAAARTLERMAVLAIHLNRRHRSRSGRFRVVGI